MPKDPAMFIRLSDFTDILANNGFASPKKLAMRIFTQAVPLNIKNRYRVEGDAKTREKAHKVIKSAKTEDMTVQRFNRILDAERRKVGHRHITQIQQGSKDYQLLKDVAILAVNFAHEAGIANVDEGCQMYIQLGLEKMKRHSQYALGKFKYYDHEIYRMYESYDTVASDPEPELTKEVYDAYTRLLAEYAGFGREFSSAEDYVCFIFARIEAQKVGADMEDWVRAQFEELGRMYDSIPNPNQLFSEAALRRYYSYFRTPKSKQEEIIVSTRTSGDDFTRKYEEKLKQLYSEK